ncbi:MAG TPA: hypothetical protein HA362_08155 [Nanoarchaeota archaeon]|nr:hypothetical protein [Nanoarchaeota archaeon]
MAFDPETIIAMADGQFVAIGDIEKGDEVMAVNLADKSQCTAKVLDIIDEKVEKAATVMAVEEINCSENQLFVMSSFSAKKASELRPGDILLKEGLAETAVKSVRPNNKLKDLLTLKTDKGTFMAEGVFVNE